jgi:hypothetical protein
LSGQIDLFKEYLGKLKGLVGEDRTKFILANSVFLVVQGSNDISNTYFLSHARQLQYDVPAYTDLMLNSASNFLKVYSTTSFLNLDMFPGQNVHIYTISISVTIELRSNTT